MFLRGRFTDEQKLRILRASVKAQSLMEYTYDRVLNDVRIVGYPLEKNHSLRQEAIREHYCI